MKYKVTLNKRVYEVEVEEGTAMLVDEYELAAPASMSTSWPPPPHPLRRSPPHRWLPRLPHLLLPPLLPAVPWLPAMSSRVRCPATY